MMYLFDSDGEFIVSGKSDDEIKEQLVIMEQYHGYRRIWREKAAKILKTMEGCVIIEDINLPRAKKRYTDHREASLHNDDIRAAANTK